MKIFLSHSSKDKKEAGFIAETLTHEGHDVFFDKDSLKKGTPYDHVIREAIEACDFFIFLISTHSLAKGSYARTELKFARERWPIPDGQFLAVQIGSFSADELPPYLKKITFLQPEGDPAAEIAFEIKQRITPETPSPPTPESPPPPSRSMWAKVVVGILMIAIVSTALALMVKAGKDEKKESSEEAAAPILTLDSKVGVAHNLGIPAFMATIRLYNPTNENIQVDGIELELVSPEGKQISMFMEAISLNGQVVPPLPTLFADSGKEVFYQYSFFNYQVEFQTLHQEISNYVSANNPELNAASPPEPSRKILPEDMTAKIRNFARRQFIWKSGEWGVRLSATAGPSRKLLATYRFTLDESEVTRMKNIMEHYESGVGVFPPWRFVSMGDFQPFLEKRLKPTGATTPDGSR